MKTLIISDTHLTNKFQKKKYDKLVDLINKFDFVIINGDFWEGLQITFDQFVNSEWNKLFPLLKAKNTVYIYGNHDAKEYSDERVYQFCDKAVDYYEVKTSTQNYYFTHGQKFLFPKIQEVRPINEVFTKRNLIFEKVTSQLQGLIIKILGPHAFPKSFNKMTLEQRKTFAPIDSLLVCGHSHTPQHNKEMNFFDLGFFNFGWANYMVVDEKGKFEFVSEKY